MEADVDGVIGAGRFERSAERADLAQRLPRPDPGDAAGALEPEDPQAEDGQLLPGLPGAKVAKTVEKALVSVIQEAWIAGVSTRRVDELVQAMGMSVGIGKIVW